MIPADQVGQMLDVIVRHTQRTDEITARTETADRVDQ